jgi:spore germination cell wall hydrolase CwlJ-like protein
MKTILLYVLLISQSIAALGASSELSRQQKVVAITILAEARGEGDKGMGAVAAVIAQRAIDRKQTWEKVCLTKYQFSCWNGKKISDLDHLLDVPQAEMAIYLAKNMHRIDRSKIGNANHYYADYIKAPYWAKGETPTIKIGRHIFYRL